MAETSERERKKVLAEIMRSVKEYTKENVVFNEALKAEILNLLKLRRPVKIVDYDYGLSRTFKKDCRLIIKESEDKTKAREYIKISNSWYCSHRVSQRAKCLAANLEIKNGIIFAPINHNDKCETKDYSHVMEVQEFYKQGKGKEAWGLIKKKSSNINSNQSLSDSMLNDSILDTTAELENLQSVSPNTAVSVDTNLTPSSRRSSTAATEIASTESTQTSVKREFSEFDDCMVVEEPPAKMPKLEENGEEKFAFGRPSDSVLQKMCEKLQIEYNHDAYKLWGDIIFKQIPTVPHNIQTHDFKSKNLYACLSLLFTGTVLKCHLIENTVCAAFCGQLIKNGSKSLSEMNQIFTNHTVTDELLDFVSTFLSCNIGIYEGCDLKKFGKWKPENNTITLILSFVDGLYSVVLNL